MTIYIVLLVMINVFFLIKKIKKETALLWSFLLITLLACLRSYNVGVDTSLFYEAFSTIGKSSSWDYTLYRYEPGFFYLCKILYNYIENAQIIIIVTSLFVNFSVYNFIKKFSSNYLLSTVLYVVMNIFFSYMNTMREALAIAVLLFGFKYLINKKYLKYLIIVIVAAQFHTAAWAAVLLPIILICSTKNKKYIYYILIFAGIVAFALYESFFGLLTNIFGYEEYSTSVFAESNYFGSLINFAEILIILLINIYYLIKKKQKEFFKDRKTYILCIAGILFLIFSLLIMRMNIFNRIAQVFEIYIIIFIPELLSKIKELSKDDYKIMKFLTLGTYTASFIIISIFRPEWYGCVPYELFL